MQTHVHVQLPGPLACSLGLWPGAGLHHCGLPSRVVCDPRAKPQKDGLATLRVRKRKQAGQIAMI